MASPLSVTKWCSPQNKQGSCSPISSIACSGGPVCKPMYADTLALFKSLQLQLNRVLVASGQKAMGIDGRIGPCTVQAINKTASVHGMTFVDCNAVSAASPSVVAALKQAADKLGAPAQVSAPAPRAPASTANPDGSASNPSNFSISMAGFAEFLMSPLGIAVIAGSGLALWQISKATKPGGKSKKQPLLGWI